MNPSDANYGACLQTLIGHTNTVQSVAFAPDGRTLASGSWDDTIKLWDVNPHDASYGACLDTLTGHTSIVWSVSFAPDGQTLVSGSQDRTVKLWDMNPNDNTYCSCVQNLTGYQEVVYSVAYAPYGEVIATSGGDGAALWDLAGPLTGTTLSTSLASPQPVNTPLILTASSTGGALVQYQFWVYNPNDSPAWSQVQAYSHLNTCTWTPNLAGNYLLSVTAQDGITGVEMNDTQWYGVTDVAPLTALTVAASLASPQQVNTLISFTASATGGTNVLYQFWTYNPHAVPVWNQLQGYSSSPSCSWLPSMPGTYLLSVTAIDGVTGKEVNTLCWYCITGTTTLAR